MVAQLHYVTICLHGVLKGQFCFYFNPLNTELNPICHLLALLGAHHILHISGIRVKMLPFDVKRNWLKEGLQYQRASIPAR